MTELVENKSFLNQPQSRKCDFYDNSVQQMKGLSIC